MRGLKAPPRSSRAPLAFTARATVSICSCDSTAHGPATITNAPPPTGTPPIETTLSSGFTSRETSL